MKTFIDSQGQIHEIISLDAGIVAGGVLDGYKIDIQCNDKGKFKASYREEDNLNGKTVNGRRWLKMAEEMAEEAVAEGEWAAFTGKGCGFQITGIAGEPDLAPSAPVGMTIGLDSAANVLGSVHHIKPKR